MRAQCTFHRPDAEKLTAALNRYYFDPVGIVLCLAWRAGLGRGEIHALTWEQVDFRGEVLRLPDREVPLSPELREALLRWEKRCAALEDRHVAVSPRLKTHLQPASISILARSALDSVGLEDVTLKDLRYDCICRMLETHDWPYVLRVTGISLETYRTWFAPLFQSAAPERGASAPGGWGRRGAGIFCQRVSPVAHHAEGTGHAGGHRPLADAAAGAAHGADFAPDLG